MLHWVDWNMKIGNGSKLLYLHFGVKVLPIFTLLNKSKEYICIGNIFGKGECSKFLKLLTLLSPCLVWSVFLMTMKVLTIIFLNNKVGQKTQLWIEYNNGHFVIKKQKSVDFL